MEAVSGEVMGLVGWQRGEMSEILAFERGAGRDADDVVSWE